MAASTIRMYAHQQTGVAQLVITHHGVPGSTSVHAQKIAVSISRRMTSPIVPYWGKR
jgi:hypothetical protein